MRARTAAVAGLIGALATAVALAAGAQTFLPPADPVLGETLYKERCASCHDAPTGRTPGRAAIADNTPNYLFAVMTEGVMKPMAEGLTWQQLGALARYVSTREAGGARAAALEAPLCKGKPKPLTLDGAQWNGWGRDAVNSRFQPRPGLKAADVPRLKVKWAFPYAGGRNGQATVVGGRVFVNSSSGAVYALDAKTGCAWWRFDADQASRTSIVIGALPASMAPHRFAAYFADFSKHAYAVDAETGQLIWKTQVDWQEAVMMTGSIALHEGRLYIPVSSAEEAFATNDAYECCKFRGSVAAVDALTGKLIWKVYTVDKPPAPFKKNAKGTQMYGPAGGAIWSAPTVDAKRGLIYVATGDSYTDVEHPGSDAIMALDMQTGAVRWSNQVTPGDAYLIGCGPMNPRQPANCPTETGPDADFGASPILVTLANGKQLLLAGQKSSEIYALDPDNGGKVVWKHRLSPGGPLGGIEFGPAIDGEAVYIALADIFVPGAKPGLTAIRIADGAILWTTPAPSPAVCAWKGPFCNPALSQAITAIPGAVFAGSMDGHFRAYRAGDGKVIWDFNTAVPHTGLGGRTSQGGVMDGAGPTVAGGMVYVHTGYQGRSGEPGNVLLAFSVDGK